MGTSLGKLLGREMQQRVQTSHCRGPEKDVPISLPRSVEAGWISSFNQTAGCLESMKGF
jgi:hypothetical protein